MSTVNGASGGRHRATPPRSRHRRRPVRTLARALRWTVASAFLPGVGHLVAGRSRAGLFLLGSFGTLLAAGAVLLTAVPRTRLLQIGVKPDELEFLAILCGALAVAWVLVVLSAWAVHKPEQLRSSQRVLATGVVAALSIGVAAPFAVGARTAFVQRDLIQSVFQAPEPPGPVLALPPAVKDAAPGLRPAGGAFANKARLNVLLLGGDGGQNRTGVRTDTMILASIDTRTGRTVLISLPRNMMRAQFPTGTEMARRFPNGYTDLLNSVYTYAEANPQVVPGSPYPGGTLIKQVFSYTIGQPVDYFVLVNLAGFQDIVDAFGGVTMNVTTRLPIGGRHDANGNPTTPPTGYIEPGRQKLDGYEALWYGRSRFDSDDYARMNRQRCLLGAIAQQASPLKVLTNFGKLASAAKRIILTDIPRDVLPDLLALADKAKSAKVTSVTFVRSAAFDPANPRFSYVQEQVRRALAEAVAPVVPSATPSVSATPAPGKKKKTKKPQPEAISQPVAASLESVCDY